MYLGKGFIHDRPTTHVSHRRLIQSHSSHFNKQPFLWGTGQGRDLILQCMIIGPRTRDNFVARLLDEDSLISLISLHCHASRSILCHAVSRDAFAIRWRSSYFRQIEIAAETLAVYRSQKIKSV